MRRSSRKAMVAVRISVQRRRLVCNRLCWKKLAKRGIFRQKRKRLRRRINRKVRRRIKDKKRSRTGDENGQRIDERMTKRITQAVLLLSLVATAVIGALGQSRHTSKGGDLEGTLLSVTASRSDGKKDPIKIDNLSLYENGFEQKIRNFAYDPSPSRIVLLVDNSETLPADIEKLKKATMEFAYEIFDGDQLFVLAYDEKAEIVQEWTDDAKKMETSLATFRKKGNPFLFDALGSALNEVLIPLMPGTRKTAIVVIGDGLDRGS